MGKLFDRLDHEWELVQIDKTEQQVGAIHCPAHARFESFCTACAEADSTQLTGFQIATLEQVGRSDRYRLAKSKVGPAVGYFEKLRRASRMKLLQTGSLMSDLRAIRAICKACPKCYEDETGLTKGCELHRKRLYKVMKAIKYAGEANMGTRLAQGRVWGEDEAELTRDDRGLNKFEKWYSDDKRDGQWTGLDAKRYDVPFTYLGWLEARLEDEEITFPEFSAEKARLAKYAQI